MLTVRIQTIGAIVIHLDLW